MAVEIPSFDIELMVSGKAAKLLRIEPAARSAAEMVDFLAEWRVELAVDGYGQKLFLITNAVTAFSIVLPRKPKVSFEQLADEFVRRLGSILLEVKPPVKWTPGQVRAVKGNNPSLIGTMNNMVYLLQAQRARSGTVQEEANILNDTPFFAIPEIFPRKAFYGRLGEVPRLRRAMGIFDPLPDEELGRAESEDSAMVGAVIEDPDALSPEAELEELRKNVELAERSLGRAIFEECKGAFWGFTETRPYMRSRAALAERLQSMGRSAEAIAEWFGMLELNPNDNQGIRYLLLAEVLAAKKMDAAAELFAKYSECESNAVFAWGRVLERLLNDDHAGAEQALAVARRQNELSEAYIKGHKRLPERTYDRYSPGSKEEAACFASALHNAWSKHPKALKWLREQPRSR